MKIKMNSSEVVILCIFTLIAFSKIRSASGKDFPLYLAVENNSYELIYDVDQDPEHKQYVVKGTGRAIIQACPLVDGPQLYKIERVETKKMSVPLEEICENQVESQTYNNVDGHGSKAVGFAVLPVPYELINPRINEDSSDSDEMISIRKKQMDRFKEYVSDEEEHNEKSKEDTSDQNKTSYQVVELIRFKFDESESLERIKYTQHRIAPGKLLDSEITRTGYEKYEKNEFIYNFNLDALLYSQFSLFSKVQLVPEEDFFFESWKSASRQDILTAPMWIELLPQWQNMEIFIRDVTRVIDSVDVKTGVSDTLYEHKGVEGKYSIPKYFWKSVFIDFEAEGKRYKQGILFVLPNIVDPLEKSKEQEICSDDKKTVSETGWTTVLDDDKSMSLMQVCLSNSRNMESFVEGPYEDYDALNLNKAPVKFINDSGYIQYVKEVNVFEKIMELKNANNQDEKTQSKLSNFLAKVGIKV